MNLGAEPKKVITLGVLVAVAAIVFFINSGSSGETAPPSRPAAGAPASVAPRPNAATETDARPRRENIRQSTEFKPSLLKKRGEPTADPTTIDPALRLDVLAKLQAVNVEGTRRSIFDFGQAPPPKLDPAKIAAAKPPVPSPLAPKAEEAQGADTPPAKPQAPPVPLKFYGFISPVSAPAKRAFFMEGEDIHVASEGELIKRRYKIVRIGINSAVVEDTQFGSQQTLPLEEQPG